MKRSVGWLALLALGLSSCTTAGNLSSPPLGTQARSPVASATAHRRGHGRLVLHIHVPKKRRGRHHAPRYVSPATQSLTIALSGPTTVNQTVNLTPTSTGCSSSLTGTFCTLSIGGLAVGNYTGSIATYDQTGGAGNELSANQSISFAVVAGQSNTIGITLGGIPASVLFVPSANATLSGNMTNGYTLSKCGTDLVGVYGVDADGDIILGAGAPAPSLSSDNTELGVLNTPSSTPNTFALVRSTPPPTPESTVHLTATVTPDTDTGASPVSSSAMPMTFNHDICGYLTSVSLANNSAVRGITAGPDGNLWFTEYEGDKIGSVTTGGAVTLYSSGISSNAQPNYITAGPDGNLWFTEYNGDRIGRITTAGTVTQFSTGMAANSLPTGITAGPDGQLWDAQSGGPRIGTATTAGVLGSYSAGVTSVQRITAGPDGRLWFTGNGGVGAITTSGVVTEYSAGFTGTQTSDITQGPDGNLWFTENGGGAKVGKITTSGLVTEYSAGITGNVVVGITQGPDGNLWFAESNNELIGRITPSGTVTEFSVAFDASSNLFGKPWDITQGPDSAIWFTSWSDTPPNQSVIGRMQ